MKKYAVSTALACILALGASCTQLILDSGPPPGADAGAPDAGAQDARPDDATVAVGGPEADAAADSVRKDATDEMPPELDATGGTDANLTADASDGGTDAPDANEGGIVIFGSGPEWASFTGGLLPGVDDAGTPLGPAAYVCASSQVPSTCPPDAYYEGSSTPTGWSAGESFSAPPWAAHWVWKPLVASDVSDLVEVGFTKTFTLGGPPLHATITVGADDYAAVFVDDAFVAEVGSVTVKALASDAQNSGATFDLTSRLHAGPNKITVLGQNGPASYASCGGACTYTDNTAGVIFAGSIAW
ncbi:MAG TPA: hypothetical protein VGI39_26715 [Polyangiaceae bacterium]|jgi:hypothetical protein